MKKFLLFLVFGTMISCADKDVVDYEDYVKKTKKEAKGKVQVKDGNKIKQL